MKEFKRENKYLVLKWDDWRASKKLNKKELAKLHEGCLKMVKGLGLDEQERRSKPKKIPNDIILWVKERLGLLI